MWLVFYKNYKKDLRMKDKKLQVTIVIFNTNTEASI